MLTKRVIPCLDVRDGRVVKGVQFKDIVDIASPVELAAYYTEQGADELVFYDITASHEKRQASLNFIADVADCINIPFCVGGGVKVLEDFDMILKSGADKVSINSSAITSPDLIRQASKKYGNQCVVVSIDAKKLDGTYQVVTHGGRNLTGLNAIDWAQKVVNLGAGELVINSIDEDGMRNGYDLELLRKITDVVNVPVIASGGAGQMQHFYEAIDKADVDGILAASVFHKKEIIISDLKDYLISKNIEMRRI